MGIVSVKPGFLEGAMKQGRMFSTFQSFLVILPNEPERTTFIELYTIEL